MKKNSKEVVLEFDLPEFSKKDIKVRLSKNRAQVRAEKSNEKKVQKKDFFHEEKSFKSFNYSTSLPDVNHTKAESEFKNGVLRVKVPRG